MDQVKEILRQAIKYRFWIAVGISALLPVIAYVVGSGPIKAKAASERQAIEDAEKGVKQYTSPGLPNGQYKEIVDEEKEELSKDVNATWKKLYARQAPLLTWPSNVEERFRTWGNKWPENIDASTVQVAIIEYVNDYPKQVTDVYQTFRPFDTVEGTGVVSAPPEAMLLKPAPFKVEGSEVPPLGKVWAAQERLWIQRALLKVVDEVNTGAKDWDAARIKQVNLVEVGTSAAQDQVSIAGGLTLEEAPSLAPGGDAAAPAPEASAESPEASAMMMMGGGGGALQNTDAVYYIKTDSPQYKSLPFQLVVLIEQDNIQDLLVGLENSPMAIQVAEMSIAKPSTRVTKPEKGANMGGMYGDMAMMYGRSQMMMPGMGVTGFGGSSMMMMQGAAMGGMPGMGMMGGPMETKKGIDRRSVNRGQKLKEEEEKRKKAAAVTIHDPYYTVVELTIYGQARFYNPPPPEEAAAPSENTEPGDTPAAETPTAEAEKKDEAPKAEPDAAKPDAEKKDEAPKAEAEKKEEAPKEEAPKPDAEKKDTPAPDPKKDESAKAESAAPKSR